MPRLIYKDGLPSQVQFQKDLQHLFDTANPVDDLLELVEELRHFETKYKMSSEEFYRAFQQGSLDDELQHCMEWAGTYQIFIKTKCKLETMLAQMEDQKKLGEVPA